jgi:general secretion pathway protein K
VLWLSAALSAIAFSLATTVRGEAERTSTVVDGLRSYYLATGAIERSIVWLLWSPFERTPEGLSRYYNPGVPLTFSFPAGDAMVEVIPETAKININFSSPEILMVLMSGLGIPPDRGRAIVEGIVDWRNPVGPAGSLLDAFYLSQTPSFRPRHASFEEIEELLLVRGVTPDLFYGTYEHDPATGRLVSRPGLVHCLSVFGSAGQYDVNYAQPAVLLAAGVPPDVIAAILERRRMQPFQSGRDLAALAAVAGVNMSRLRVGGHSIYTLRATARLRGPDGQLGDMRRTVGALLKIMPAGHHEGPYHILRWYDSAWALN